jgi:type II secretory pathway pseudopilin PulG
MKKNLKESDAFTMIEMLVIVSVLGILLAMLYSAIRSVQRFSRESITRNELKNIEAAFKQYYAHYQCWPTGITAATASPMFPAGTGDIQYTLDENFARMLQGAAITNGATIDNADGIAFLEFTRFNKAGEPVNAWGPDLGGVYYVMLDVDGNNEVSPPGPSNNFTPTNIFRSVVVWTEHPEKEKYLLTSWER